MSAQNETKHENGTDVIRRHLLKLTGAGVATFGAASVAP